MSSANDEIKDRIDAAKNTKINEGLDRDVKRINTYVQVSEGWFPINSIYCRSIPRLNK